MLDALQTDSCSSALSQFWTWPQKIRKLTRSPLCFLSLAPLLNSLPRDRRVVNCWRLRRLHCIYLTESVGHRHGKSISSSKRQGRFCRKDLIDLLVPGICPAEYGCCRFHSTMRRSSMSCCIYLDRDAMCPNMELL